MKSNQAQVAKLCKQYLTARGITCCVKSASFSMGNSVSITVYDQAPDALKELQKEFRQYEQGHFNGMEDIYEYSNRRDDIPQTKYLSVQNDTSDELKQAAWDWLRVKWIGGESLPEKYTGAYGPQLSDVDASTMTHRLLTGALNGVSVEFWAARRAPVAAPTVAAPVEGVRTEQHLHTKRGFNMSIVIPPRVSREQFDALLEQCKAAGGWYSRQWGQTPGGFAFKESAAAEAFAATMAPTGAAATMTPTDPMTPKRLRDIADKMQPKIDDKMWDRLANTPKRVAQAQHSRQEGGRLERAQKLLRALADLHESDTVPDVLRHVKTSAAAVELVRAKSQHVANGYHGYVVDLNQPADDQPGTLAAWALLKADPEREKAEALRRKLQGLQFANIPGYFPTPAPVIAAMLDRADLQPGHRVLEPSAGHGALCDAARTLCGDIVPHEVNHTLAGILRDKGYAVTQGDFLDTTPAPTFDRVLMNPPFEGLADIDHVRHAFDYLKEGGRLVAVMSAGAFFNSRSKAADFRQWAEHHGAEVIDLPDGSFKESGTGVSTKLVIIDK